MSRFRILAMGLGLGLAVLSSGPARAQGLFPTPPQGAAEKKYDLQTFQSNPSWEWIFLGNESDPGSGLNLTALDDAARAHLKLPKGEGLLVVALAPQSPAAHAGVTQNDILLSLEDHPLAKPEDLEVQLKSAGDKPLTLGLLHQGQKKTLRVQPQVRVTFGPVRQPASSYWVGVQVAAVEPALRSHLALPADRGLIVTEVVADGPAAKAGLKANDILLTLAGTPLHDQATLVAAVQKHGDKPATVELVREGKPQSLELTPQKRAVAVTADFTHTYSSNLNFVRPGVVLQDVPHVSRFFYPDSASPGVVTGRMSGYVTAADTADKRLEAMDREIKELRRAVEDLTKALKERK